MLFTCENFTQGYLFVQISIDFFLVNKLLYIGYLTMCLYLLDNCLLNSVVKLFI